MARQRFDPLAQLAWEVQGFAAPASGAQSDRLTPDLK